MHSRARVQSGTKRMRIIKLTMSEDFEFSFIPEGKKHKPILISVGIRCQLCRKLSLFHVALQISTHAFVRESIQNGSFIFAVLLYFDKRVCLTL